MKHRLIMVGLAHHALLVETLSQNSEATDTNVCIDIECQIDDNVSIDDAYAIQRYAFHVEQDVYK